MQAKSTLHRRSIDAAYEVSNRDVFGDHDQSSHGVAGHRRLNKVAAASDNLQD